MCLGLNITLIWPYWPQQTIGYRILIKTASTMDNRHNLYPSTWQGCWSSCLLWTEEALRQRRSQWFFTCKWVLWCEWTCKPEGTVFGSEVNSARWISGLPVRPNQSESWCYSLHNRNLHCIICIACVSSRQVRTRPSRDLTASSLNLSLMWMATGLNQLIVRDLYFLTN